MKKRSLWVLALGVFGILNTEMGVVGLLPAIADQYGVSLTTAGLLVSLFALAIAVSGPVLPILLSRLPRKEVMVGVLAIFTVANFVAAFAGSFQMLLVARVVPAFFHPVFVSFALAAAADLAGLREDVPKAVAQVIMGVSAGMVLGAPVAGLIANTTSLRWSLLFFAFVNVIALIGTLLFVPAFGRPRAVSYGAQLRVLKEKRLWLALVGVMLLNGSIFGVYSYVSSYLDEVLLLPAQLASIVLFLYGLMNMVGNAIAGRGLAGNVNRFMSAQPLVIGAVYLLLLVSGSAVWTATVVMLVWGIAAGMVANTIQYWVTSAAPGAPEFANGLYLTAANLGISLATPFCSVFIDQWGMSCAPIGGLTLVAASAVCIAMQVRRCVPQLFTKRVD